MNDYYNLIVLGTPQSVEISRSFARIGFEPVMVESVEQAVDLIGTCGPMAVVVDLDNVDVDPVEFLLAVRDLEEDLPVVFIGCRKTVHMNEDYVWAQFPDVFRLSGLADVVGLAGALHAVANTAAAGCA